MPLLPIINPDIRPRLKRGKGRRLKFRARSPFRGWKVNPRRKRRVVRRRNFGRTLMVVNPRHRTRRRRMPAGLARYWASHRRGNPVHHRRRRSYVHNNPALPSSIRRVFSGGNVVDALWGAAGFIGTKQLPQVLPIPASFKIGPLSYVTELVTAWGLGTVAGRFAGKRVGNMIWVGGMIAVAADVVQQVVLPMIPSLTPVTPTPQGASGYLSRGSLGAYLPYGVNADGGAW